MNLDYYPGQKVVYTDAPLPAELFVLFKVNNNDNNCLKGQVYNIARVCKSKGYVFIQLKEFPHNLSEIMYKGFWAGQFRPVLPDSITRLLEVKTPIKEPDNVEA